MSVITGPPPCPYSSPSPSPSPLKAALQEDGQLEHSQPAAALQEDALPESPYVVLGWANALTYLPAPTEFLPEDVVPKDALLKDPMPEGPPLKAALREDAQPGASLSEHS